MQNFTVEEVNLMCIYDTGDRSGLIREIEEMTRYLTPDETELSALADAVLNKLRGITDEQYAALMNEMIPDYEEMEE